MMVRHLAIALCLFAAGCGYRVTSEIDVGKVAGSRVISGAFNSPWVTEIETTGGTFRVESVRSVRKGVPARLLLCDDGSRWLAVEGEGLSWRTY